MRRSARGDARHDAETRPTRRGNATDTTQNPRPAQTPGRQQRGSREAAWRRRRRRTEGGESSRARTLMLAAMRAATWHAGHRRQECERAAAPAPMGGHIAPTSRALTCARADSALRSLRSRAAPRLPPATPPTSALQLPPMGELGAKCAEKCENVWRFQGKCLPLQAGGHILPRTL